MDNLEIVSKIADRRGQSAVNQERHALTERRVAVVVLGMHRSGTSALARVLSLLGCQLPQILNGALESNPGGHWEAASIQQFNDALLQDIGSSWSDWTPVNPGFAKSAVYATYRDQAVELLQTEFGAAPLVVLKDPRMCRLSEFWMDALERSGFRPLVILPVRNPLEVAASLAQRDGLDESYAQLLWLRHVLDAESSTRGGLRVFTKFEDLLDGWEALVERVATGLDIAWPRFSEKVADEIDSYLDAGLRHHARTSHAVIENPRLSAWLRDTYAVLHSWAQNGEDVCDYAKLDDVVAQLETAAPAFARLIHSGEKSRLRVLDLETQASGFQQAEQQVRVLQQQLAELNRQPNMQLLLSEEQNRSNVLTGELAVLRGQLADLETALGRKQEEAAQLPVEQNRSHVLTGELGILQNRLAELDSALRQKQEEAAQAWAELAAQIEATAKVNERNELLETQSSALTQSLADSEGWVFRIAGERRQAEGRADKLDREVQQLTRRMFSLEGKAARLRDTLAAEYRSRQRANADAPIAEPLNDTSHTDPVFEVGGSRVSPVEEAGVAGQKLERLQMAISAAEKEARLLRDALAASASKVDRQQQELAEAQAAARMAEDRTLQAELQRNALDGQLIERFGELAELTRLLRQSVSDVDEAKAELKNTQTRLDDRFAEVAKLTQLYRASELQVEGQRQQVEWLRQLHALLQVMPRWWSLMPRGWRTKREVSRLQRKGHFDGEAYLSRYPDVSAAGMHPLRHYILHGLAEGRNRL